ncbi:hypothetical protein HU200_036953 [Digitaria exilis]|uniref:RING-type domain-containing protein n=1 Tax=Digitaria exilis TaxID=1010633 RepID=A0A835BFA0_9POAL|nr:hypothetical protein HU200_036953 [Digitaria exilis]
MNGKRMPTITTSALESPPRTKAILGLQEVSAGEAVVAECAVCLQDFVAEHTLRAMPCSHTFHHKCIFDWLRINHLPTLSSRIAHARRRRRILETPEHARS